MLVRQVPSGGQDLGHGVERGCGGPPAVPRLRRSFAERAGAAGEAPCSDRLDAVLAAERAAAQVAEAEADFAAYETLLQELQEQEVVAPPSGAFEREMQQVR